MKFTLRQFNERFPTSDSCLEELKQLRFEHFVCPKCKREDMLSKIGGRPQYACPCGYQVAPLAGTIFNKSRTDLRTWFFAMYLMTQTRAGISAKQLERMTGVTYKTAWRMFREIRTLMNENDGDLLGGIVEVDETYLGGVQKGMLGRNPKGNKTVVQGMVERGGRVRTQVVANAKAPGLIPNIQKNVKRGSWVVSDELTAYKILPRLGYNHRSINHSRGNYVDGSIYTNTIEGFWSVFKGGVKGVYRHIGKDYVDSYAWEYAWRYSHRKSEIPMFELLLARV